MLISLNWIRDFVDLPADLDPRELAERFTRTTAEVDDVDPVNIEAKGLIVARILSVIDLPDSRDLRLVRLDVGGGKTADSASSAAMLHPGANVLYAPVGAHVASLGAIRAAKVAGKTSRGMILPGDAVGIDMAAREAVFLDESAPPGAPIESSLFDDWVLNIDNKSLTHRPDLWGHYGIARELAAMYGRSLKPYPGVAIEELTDPSLPEVPIVIADPQACPRYSGIVLSGVPTQPAPLWMQLRIGRLGLRPISGLVDLTNYIMAELGQPMHAFDAAKVDRIEIDWAKPGEKFQTLDGAERDLSETDLMIQCRGRSVALAGVMGGLETEVTEETKTLLLESANFDAATIRRTAARLALRSDASARFEKSLDPTNTVLAIRRFVHLARGIYPKMRLASRLSDGHPKPRGSVSIAVDPRRVSRMIGRDVTTDEISRILGPLEFDVQPDGAALRIGVPSFRATGDVAIEEDVIEEIARYVGYNSIEPAMPQVSMRRFELNALHDLENRTLRYFTGRHAFHEIQSYLWYDASWLARLGIEPGDCVELRNPPAAGQERLRRRLLPGLLACVEKNRFHFPALSLIEVGSVFLREEPEDREDRHVALILAQRRKQIEDTLFLQLKGAIQSWAWTQCAEAIRFDAAESCEKWEHPRRTARILLGEADVGRVSLIDPSLRRAISEHLAAWSIAWAELRLTALDAADRPAEPLASIPPFPQVELDFSVVVDGSTHFANVVRHLKGFSHPLLRQIRFVDSYEGEAVGPNRRSLTFRTVVGDDTRTLVEADTQAFRTQFEKHLTAHGYEIRA